MSRKPPRELSKEDRAAWEGVARRVTPLRRLIADRAGPEAEGTDGRGAVNGARPKPAGDAFWPQDMRLGGRAAAAPPKHDLAPDPRDSLARLSQPLDRKTSTRLKRGKLSPEARIDLHGMTQAEAYPALSGFVRRSHAAGHRLVLVITGKGKERDESGPIPARRGVLRHQVPQWLRSGGLGPLVLHITEAHARHGGHGALYVYLRRNRSANAKM